MKYLNILTYFQEILMSVLGMENDYPADGVPAFASVPRCRYPGYYIIHYYITFTHFII
jgi:hypothetical protein